MRRRWTLTSLLALTLGLSPGTPPAGAQAPPPDTRQAVALPAPARDKVLAEMRGMLESLHGILKALSVNDRAGAETAARAAGMAAAADVRPEMRRLLPAAFLQMGMGTHQAFDRLAGQLGAGADLEAAVRGLADLTGNCVACHAVYRLDEAR